MKTRKGCEMERVGVALIGAGLFGERHAQAYSRHHAVNFVAVCDLNLPRAEQIAERYNAGYATDDLSRVLNDPDVVAVSIATPDHLHRTGARQGRARRGEHAALNPFTSRGETLHPMPKTAPAFKPSPRHRFSSTIARRRR